MDEFLFKLQKIGSGFVSRMKLLFVLDIVAIFSIFYAIFIIFQVEYFLTKSTFNLPIPVQFIPPVLAFIIAIIGTLILHRKDNKINVILVIENKYPDLKEKLRTAFDNRNETNIIVDSLKGGVSDAMEKVSSSHLFTKSKIISKILITIIFIAGAAIIALNPDQYGIPPGDIANFSKTITGNTENLTGPIQVIGRPENLNHVSASGGGEIFGKPKIASIQGKNIDLTIYSGMGTGFEIKDVSQTQNQFIRSAAFPVDVLGSNVSDGGYSLLMKKTETEKQLIDKYAVERSKI
ncbi:Uncharacterised protein [uncultured archaeon]|nr:Uncharacterised protein [uncultured archaeon]